MKKTALLLYSFLLLLACQNVKKEKANASLVIPQKDWVCQTADSTKLQAILDLFQNKKDLPIGELVVAVGKQFLEVPYVSHSLEHGQEEPLTINLHELDCTTFAETALALARTIKAPESNIQHFAHELEKIRYRDGKRDGYPSRLHYFSDWIFNNEQKGIVDQPAKEFGKPLEIQVNFMSSHPKSYSVLKENPNLVPEIANQEKTISSRHYFYIPKNEISANEKFLKDGDIIGIVTNIKGLDIAHVGILAEVNGHMHLLNASTLHNKVVISNLILVDFLNRKKSYTGIMISRPV